MFFPQSNRPRLTCTLDHIWKDFKTNNVSWKARTVSYDVRVAHCILHCHSHRMRFGWHKRRALMSFILMTFISVLGDIMDAKCCPRPDTLIHFWAPGSVSAPKYHTLNCDQRNEPWSYAMPACTYSSFLSWIMCWGMKKHDLSADDFFGRLVADTHIKLNCG